MVQSLITCHHAQLKAAHFLAGIMLRAQGIFVCHKKLNLSLIIQLGQDKTLTVVNEKLIFDN